MKIVFGAEILADATRPDKQDSGLRAVGNNSEARFVIAQNTETKLQKLSTDIFCIVAERSTIALRPQAPAGLSPEPFRNCP
ncbi:hypothetical protein [Roseicyclus sp.]|uniref:hypothetical protein n=1 Tax=Roseicyclus sp. TaxID=1914329 RepID=UPI003F9F6901